VGHHQFRSKGKKKKTFGEKAGTIAPHQRRGGPSCNALRRGGLPKSGGVARGEGDNSQTPGAPVGGGPSLLNEQKSNASWEEPSWGSWETPLIAGGSQKKSVVALQAESKKSQKAGGGKKWGGGSVKGEARTGCKTESPVGRGAGKGGRESEQKPPVMDDSHQSPPTPVVRKGGESGGSSLGECQKRGTNCQEGGGETPRDALKIGEKNRVGHWAKICVHRTKDKKKMGRKWSRREVKLERAVAKNRMEEGPGVLGPRARTKDGVAGRSPTGSESGGGVRRRVKRKRVKSAVKNVVRSACYTRRNARARPHSLALSRLRKIKRGARRTGRVAEGPPTRKKTLRFQQIDTG